MIKIFLFNFIHFMWVSSNNFDLRFFIWKTCSPMCLWETIKCWIAWVQIARVSTTPLFKAFFIILLYSFVKPNEITFKNRNIFGNLSCRSTVSIHNSSVSFSMCLDLRITLDFEALNLRYTYQLTTILTSVFRALFSNFKL